MLKKQITDLPLWKDINTVQCTDLKLTRLGLIQGLTKINAKSYSCLYTIYLFKSFCEETKVGNVFSSKVYGKFLNNRRTHCDINKDLKLAIELGFVKEVKDSSIKSKGREKHYRIIALSKWDKLLKDLFINDEDYYLDILRHFPKGISSVSFGYLFGITNKNPKTNMNFSPAYNSSVMCSYLSLCIGKHLKTQEQIASLLGVCVTTYRTHLESIHLVKTEQRHKKVEDVVSARAVSTIMRGINSTGFKVGKAFLKRDGSITVQMPNMYKQFSSNQYLPLRQDLSFITKGSNKEKIEFKRMADIQNKHKKEIEVSDGVFSSVEFGNHNLDYQKLIERKELEFSGVKCEKRLAAIQYGSGTVLSDDQNSDVEQLKNAIAKSVVFDTSMSRNKMTITEAKANVFTNQDLDVRVVDGSMEKLKYREDKLFEYYNRCINFVSETFSVSRINKRLDHSSAKELNFALEDAWNQIASRVWKLERIRTQYLKADPTRTDIELKHFKRNKFEGSNESIARYMKQNFSGFFFTIFSCFDSGMSAMETAKALFKAVTNTFYFEKAQSKEYKDTVQRKFLKNKKVITHTKEDVKKMNDAEVSSVLDPKINKVREMLKVAKSNKKLKMFIKENRKNTNKAVYKKNEKQIEKQAVSYVERRRKEVINSLTEARRTTMNGKALNAINEIVDAFEDDKMIERIVKLEKFNVNGSANIANKFFSKNVSLIPNIYYIYTGLDSPAVRNLTGLIPVSQQNLSDYVDDNDLTVTKSTKSSKTKQKLSFNEPVIT